LETALLHTYVPHDLADLQPVLQRVTIDVFCHAMLCHAVPCAVPCCAVQTLLKIIFVGDSGVGKTCLIERMFSNRFDTHLPATIGQLAFGGGGGGDGPTGCGGWHWQQRAGEGERDPQPVGGSGSRYAPYSSKSGLGRVKRGQV